MSSGSIGEWTERSGQTSAIGWSAASRQHRSDRGKTSVTLTGQINGPAIDLRAPLVQKLARGIPVVERLKCEQGNLRLSRKGAFARPIDDRSSEPKTGDILAALTGREAGDATHSGDQTKRRNNLKVVLQDADTLRVFASHATVR